MSDVGKVKRPEDMLRGQLVAMLPQFAAALPSHIKPEKFQRVVMTVVQQQPDLLAADRRTLLASCLKCAADGLVPDGREAALVIFNTKVKIDGRDVWVKAVQYMPMMAGILKRIRNSHEIASVQAHVIYEHDDFVIRRGMNETIEHTPKFPGDRGKPIGAYAIARFRDGSDPMFEIMDVNEINRTRAVSRSKDSGPWVTWWGEQARKTVFKRLSKWLPMDADVEAILRSDDESNGAAVIDHAPEAMPAIEAPHSSRLDALEGQITEPTEEDEGEPVEVENIEEPTTQQHQQQRKPPAGLRDRVDAAIGAIAACSTTTALGKLEGKTRALLGELEINGEVEMRQMLVDALAFAAERFREGEIPGEEAAE